MAGGGGCGRGGGGMWEVEVGMGGEVENLTMQIKP